MANSKGKPSRILSFEDDKQSVGLLHMMSWTRVLVWSVSEVLVVSYIQSLLVVHVM